jgi:hypothetical protein
MNMKVGLMAVALALGLSATAAKADTYTSADFQLRIGSVKSSSPFNGVLFGAETFTGNLVFDNNLVPGAGTGFQNIFFSTFPDIANIPSTSALSLPFPGVQTFILSDALVEFPTQDAAIQYNNGAFNGLFYVSDFTFAANQYRLRFNGNSFNIAPISSLLSPVVSGTVNLDLRLFDEAPFTPVVSAVPEPSTWAMLLLGFAGIGYIGLRQRKRMIAAS